MIVGKCPRTKEWPQIISTKELDCLHSCSYHWCDYTCCFPEDTMYPCVVPGYTESGVKDRRRYHGKGHEDNLGLLLTKSEIG
jgi:hypothetical protein